MRDNFKTETFSKTKMIGRRMFMISSAKVILALAIFGRLVSLQINETKK